MDTNTVVSGRINLFIVPKQLFLVTKNRQIPHGTGHILVVLDHGYVYVRTVRLNKGCPLGRSLWEPLGNY